MTSNKPKTPFYLIDTDSDFYKPVGVRAAICISVICWAAIELYNGQGFWGVLSGAAAVYCVYVRFVAYKPPAEKPPVVYNDEPEEDDVEPASTTDATPENKDARS